MSPDNDRETQLRDLFSAIDSMDAEKFQVFLAPSAVFRFGAAPPVEGRAAIGETVSGFFGTVAGLRHKLVNVISDGTRWVCEGSVTYTRHDASTITLPFANVFEFDGDLISGYRIYIEIGPLYAES